MFCGRRHQCGRARLAARSCSFCVPDRIFDSKDDFYQVSCHLLFRSDLFRLDSTFHMLWLLRYFQSARRSKLKFYYTVKPVLTTTSEQRPPVNKGQFEVTTASLNLSQKWQFCFRTVYFKVSSNFFNVNFLQHVSVDHPDKVDDDWQKCAKCQFYFPSGLSMIAHVKRVHRKELPPAPDYVNPQKPQTKKSRKCKFCSETFVDR